VQTVVRRAGRGNVLTIARLYLEVANEVVEREPRLRRVPASEAVERRYASRIADAGRVVLIAEADGGLVGFVDVSLERHEDEGTYHQPGIEGYVEELIVSASYRRRGVATALMVASEAWVGESGGRGLFLDTHITNAEARAFYGAIGYRELGVMLMKEL
jgi:ribosomal protein S18 acetylase RimI-like enzyme